jgi:hypothetical protein
MLLNRGDGTFGARVVLVPREKVLSLATGDLNGDGRADVLAPTDYGSPHAPLLVLLNAG